MPSTQTTRVLVFDADSGQQLLQTFCPTYNPNGPLFLPQEGPEPFDALGTRFHVVRVRERSTYERWEVDVREVSGC